MIEVDVVWVHCGFGFLGALIALAVWSKDKRITWQTVVVALVGGTLLGGYGIPMMSGRIDFAPQSENLWAAVFGFCALWLWTALGKFMNQIEADPAKYVIKFFKNFTKDESSKKNSTDFGTSGVVRDRNVNIDWLVF